MKEIIYKHIQDSINTKNLILDSSQILEKIELAANAIIDAYKQKRKLLFFGNGGSAADAQHLAAEFVGRYEIERDPLAAVALTSNTSNLTAIGNDYDYNKVFSRPLKALGVKGDVAIGISTSGKSKNVICAFETAREMGIKSIALIGDKNAPMNSLADIVINVPALKTAHIQESHIMIGHIICSIVEQKIIRHKEPI